MRYIRSVITILVSLLALYANGQTQKGYVKTKGRMVNGVHIHGQGLPGATVGIQGGNSYNVQNKDGSFSFPIPSQTFVVESVLKKNYQLVDVDVLKKSYHYSKNPLYLVMEKPEQQKQDLLDSERKIRRTLQQQLQKREDELDTLRKEHKITIEEYQKALQKLYVIQKNNEKFISDMAKEYAQMDYDQMTELNRRIHDAISNGRLAEADSLVHTKGDMKSRIEKVKYEEQVEEEREKEIEEEKRELEEVKAGTEKEKEDIAEDCMMLRERFMLELKVDSAAYYVEQLVNLDTTNIMYLGRAGIFYQTICYYDKAEDYYLRALNICRKSNENNVYALMALQTNLGTLYQFTHRFLEAEQLFKANGEIIERVGGKIHSIENNEVIFDEYLCLSNLAGLYTAKKQYAEAEEVWLKAIEILRKDTTGYSVQEIQRKKATTLFALGSTYYYNNKIEKGDSSFLEAVKIFQNLAIHDTSCYSELGGTLLFWAMCKLGQNDYDQSELLYLEALEAHSKSSSENKDFDKAQVWWGLASLYRHMKRPEESEKLFKDAIIIYKRYAQAIPQSYNHLLSRLIKEFSILYKEMGRIEECESLLLEDLEIDLWLVKMNPNEYNPQLAFLYNEIGKLKVMKKEYQEAIPFFEKALCMRRLLAQEDSTSYTTEAIETMSHLANLYTTIADSYYNNQHIVDSEKWYLKAIETQKLLAIEIPEIAEPIMATTIEHLAIIYWNLQRFQDAETMYDMLLELERKLSHLNSDYNLYYINLLYKLSQLYPKISNYKASYKIYKEWLPIIKQQYVDNPTLMFKEYAECLGRQSFYAIINKQFVEAEQLAHEGLLVDSTQHWISGNMASALLFQGKYSQAKEIYIQYKPELKEDFQKDFELFIQFDVIPNGRKKEFDKIRELIKK